MALRAASMPTVPQQGAGRGRAGGGRSRGDPRDTIRVGVVVLSPSALAVLAYAYPREVRSPVRARGQELPPGPRALPAGLGMPWGLCRIGWGCAGLAVGCWNLRVEDRE